MSTYHQYEFICPDGVFAIVKEELSSYFNSGAVDDLLFPTYVTKCLENLGLATYPIMETPLIIEDFTAVLPDNFDTVREAWACSVIHGGAYQLPSAIYTQSFGVTSTQLNPPSVAGIPCDCGDCQDPSCPDCMPEVIQAVYKTTTEEAFSYRRVFLLKPGNISVRNNSSLKYNTPRISNPYGSTMDSFDVRGNKFFTNFRNGVVHLIYYASETSMDGVQLVPDEYEVLEYIENYLKYKTFEKLYNTVTDETLNQIERKMSYYEQKSNDSLVDARTALRKRTIWQVQRGIKRTLKRMDKYEIAGGNTRRLTLWNRYR